MENKTITIHHSKKSMISYGFGKFPNEFFNMCFGMYVFFYYEVEIGLASWLTSLGYIIFAIWNAINDPLMGYLTNRPFRFTRKWGRRFPFVLMGGLPWVLSYILVFLPPSVNPQQDAWILFLWLIFTTCLFDTFGSLYTVNFYTIYPDKFRDQDERRLVAALSSLIAALGTALGAIVPPLFVKYGDLKSYIVQAIMVFIVCSIALMLAIPGCREDQVRIDSYLEKHQKGQVERSFFKEYKACLKHKNFMVYITSFTCYQILVSLMTGSINYIALFALKVPASAVMPIMAGLLVGMMCSMPVWMKIANKTDNDRRTFILASFFLAIMTVPLFFIDDYFIMIIGVIIWGFFEGAYWVMISPVGSTVIDESVVMTSERREGIYQGFQAFVTRAALIVQAVSFSVIHSITGFVEGSSTQTPEAILGIRIHFALLPAIFMLIGAVILWRFFDLTPDKVKINKEKLRELGL